MNSFGLENLTLTARIAYAVMCFERYTAFMYTGVDFKPAAEIMWHLADGGEPMQEAAETYREIIPEKLFAHRTYESYQAAGHCRLTRVQFCTLSRILNPNDWNLNSMMKHIWQLTAEYADAAVTPGAPETLPYLEKIKSMLTVRAIELPDLNLLQQYVFAQQDAAASGWLGGPVDPAPLSQLGITQRAAAVPVRSAAPEEGVPVNKALYPKISKSGADGYDMLFTASSSMSENAPAYHVEPVSPSAEVNGCTWEYVEDPDGCIITRCINGSGLKEVTVPSELNGLPVTEINDRVFFADPESGCMLIESLIMPDTIRRIGDWFFRGCSALRQIRMPASLESLGHEAFRGASRLESITIGDACRSIGDYFCADALSLRRAEIGAAIEYIGEYTFYNTPVMSEFHCSGMLKELGYGSFWVNRWADRILFNPMTELLRFCRDNALLYRYVKRTPSPRLFFDAGITYVYDYAFGGDAWHSGDGITDIFFPGAEKIGVQAFRKVPNATVHLSASRMEAAYGPDYVYALTALCEPAKVVFDQP